MEHHVRGKTQVQQAAHPTECSSHSTAGAHLQTSTSFLLCLGNLDLSHQVVRNLELAIQGQGLVAVIHITQDMAAPADMHNVFVGDAVLTISYMTWPHLQAWTTHLEVAVFRFLKGPHGTGMAAPAGKHSAMGGDLLNSLIGCSLYVASSTCMVEVAHNMLATPPVINAHVGSRRVQGELPPKLYQCRQLQTPSPCQWKRSQAIQCQCLSLCNTSKYEHRSQCQCLSLCPCKRLQASKSMPMPQSKPTQVIAGFECKGSCLLRGEGGGGGGGFRYACKFCLGLKTAVPEICCSDAT
eukprot:1144213-Pelagomonas_calceolata.AAC.5